MGKNRDWSYIKSNGAVIVFVAECKRKKNIQLCVYSAKQNTRKKMVGSSVIDNDDDIEDSVSKRIKV